MIVSGDRHETVKRLADELGIAEMYAEQSPEQKYARVMAQTRSTKTIFLGDDFLSLFFLLF
jgi:cation transport ATPase